MNIITGPKINPHSELTLQKTTHLRFLARNMLQGFPARYMSQDASQPWLLFWTLQSFSVLQTGLDPGNRQRWKCIFLFQTLDLTMKRRAVNQMLACQHPNGGFSGGPGQSPHLLPTYAAVCTMAIAGRPGPGGGWDQINRWAPQEYHMDSTVLTLLR